MSYELRKYKEVDFNDDLFKNAQNAKYELVEKDRVAPDNYHAMSIYPEYFIEISAASMISSIDAFGFP